MKQIIHVINKQKTDHVMACYIEIYSVANTLKKIHIQSSLHTGYKKSFYHDKRDKFYGIFDQYHIPLLRDINHPALIQEWKENIDAVTYEKN